MILIWFQFGRWYEFDFPIWPFLDKKVQFLYVDLCIIILKEVTAGACYVEMFIKRTLAW